MKTTRQQIVSCLTQHPGTARELSARVGVREKEILDHLPHIARSLSACGRALIVDPAMCLACGFVFTARRRYARPSRCPVCKSERIDPPIFCVTG